MSVYDWAAGLNVNMRIADIRLDPKTVYTLQLPPLKTTFKMVYMSISDVRRQENFNGLFLVTIG